MQASEHEPERPFQKECTRPKLVTAACIIWIIVGCLEALSDAAIGASGLYVALEGHSIGLLLLLLGALFASLGCYVVYMGYQTYRGKARDMLGIGIASIILGLFMRPVDIIRMNGAYFKTHGVVETVMPLCGAVLLLAGILAMMSNTRYKAWRETQNANRAAEKTTQVGQS